MASIRLSPELEEKLKTFSEVENITKTDIIKQALQAYFSEYEKKKFPYELGKDLFGKYGSGHKDLSKTYKKVLKGKLYEKHSH
jgi:predicted DNA-binding protein